MILRFPGGVLFSDAIMVYLVYTNFFDFTDHFSTNLNTDDCFYQTGYGVYFYESLSFWRCGAVRSLKRTNACDAHLLAYRSWQLSSEIGLTTAAEIRYLLIQL
jgi:hypothetical protein